MGAPGTSLRRACAGRRARLRLHDAPDNAALILRIALEELSLPYQTRLVDRRVSAQKSAACRAMTPRGLIPVRETEDGPVFETAAILPWLCDRTPGLANGPQTDLRCLVHPEDYAGENPEGRTASAAAAQARIRDTLDQLEAPAGAGHGWFAARAGGRGRHLCLPAPQGGLRSARRRRRTGSGPTTGRGSRPFRPGSRPGPLPRLEISSRVVRGV